MSQDPKWKTSGNSDTSYLADLIDDLNHKQLTDLLNYLALRLPNAEAILRPSIKKWRKSKGLS